MDFSAIVTHGLVFLFGAATGATGSYLASKYTDKRRWGEARRERRARFKEVESELSQLIAEMQDDFADKSNATVREFIVMPNRNASWISDGTRVLAFFEDQHENLRGQISVLENNGYVMNVARGNVPRYRMSEELVQLLKQRN
ncbi:hypothetical protein ACFL3X_00950 [Gemmatimonadota bacterium]